MVVQVAPVSGQLHLLRPLVLSPLPPVSLRDLSYQWKMAQALFYYPHMPLSHPCEWEQFNTMSHVHVYVTKVLAL